MFDEVLGDVTDVLGRRAEAPEGQTGNGEHASNTLCVDTGRAPGASKQQAFHVS